MPFAMVCGRTVSRALWCIMWKASMTTSQAGSCVACCSISCAGSNGPVSVMPRWPILPASRSRNSASRSDQGMVVVLRPDGVQQVDVDMLDAERAKRAIEIGADLVCREHPAIGRDLALGADHDLVARQILERQAHGRLGPIGHGGVEEGHAAIEGGPHERGGLAIGPPLAEADPAAAAAAEAGDTDLEPGVAELCVVHRPTSRLDEQAVEHETPALPFLLPNGSS